LIAGLFALPTIGQSTTLPIMNWIPPSSLGAASPSQFVATPTDDTRTVPMWLGTDNGYSFAMVGKDPTAKGSVATTIPTKIVALRFTAAPSYVFDTEDNDSCSPQRTPALNMVQQSPLFRPVMLPAPLKSLGTAQFMSLFQRANFWVPFIEPKGLNPNYQVLFSQTLVNKLETPRYTIAITSSSSTTLPYTIEGQVQTDTTWCNPVAMIEVNALDNLIQTQLIPGLRGYDVVPTGLPIFLLPNVVMYDSNTSNCCILGYHNAYLSTDTGVFSGKLQTYIVANYNSTTSGNFTGAFPNAPDIVALSNMMAGWMDNPTTLNPTPPWLGTINGTSGCQTVLEVPYPQVVSGKRPIAVTATDHNVYHVQDLAFKSWFYGDNGTPPNSGFGGNYSLFGTLTSPNLTCP
jgi:hypothetical protein